MIYIHELIEIRGHHRARYQHHMTANWVPVALAERNQRCYGVWSTIGSTGAWPQVVNMWELDGWDGLVSNFEVEASSGRDQDPSLAAWWAVAADLRRGGFDRILLPDEASAGIEELCASGVRGELYCHEIVSVPPGHSRRFLDLVRRSGAQRCAEFGIELVGAFRTAMRSDDECVLLWAAPTWRAWGRFEASWDGGRLSSWRDELLAFGATWQRTLLVDSPLSPMRIGRQPAVSDRRPLEEITG